MSDYKATGEWANNQVREISYVVDALAASAVKRAPSNTASVEKLKEDVRGALFAYFDDNAPEEIRKIAGRSQ